MNRRRRERDLDAEIRSHMEMAVRDRMDRGESREEAERAVRREFGVRVALGAGRGRVAGFVLRRALWIVGVGSACGLGGAWALSRMLESRLFGVDPFDPTVYSMSAVILAATSLLATWIPTRNAVRVDPMRVLREE